MDLNGSRCWGLDRALHWPVNPAAERAAPLAWRGPDGAATSAAVDACCGGGLQLRSGLPEGALLPIARAASPIRATVDADGALLWWNGRQLMSVGATLRTPEGRLDTPRPEPVALPAELTRIDALALGDDGVLYLASGETLWWLPRRGAALPLALPTPGFAASALAACPGGGVWAFDGTTGRLARTQGRLPRRLGVADDPLAPLRFDPVEEAPDPPRLIPLPARLDAGETGRALAADAEGRLALLVERSAEALARGRSPSGLRLLDAEAAWTPAFDLDGGWAPHGLAWLDAQSWLLLGHARLRDEAGVEIAADNPADTLALRYRVEPAALAAVLAGLDPAPPRLWPEGDHHPLPGHDGSALLRPPPAAQQRASDAARDARPAGGSPALTPAGLGGAAPHYVRVLREGAVLVGSGETGAALPALQLRALVALPQPRRLTRGWRANALPGWAAPGAAPVLSPGVIDSGDAGCTWHRLWLEARVPPGCALLVWLAASEVAPPPLPADGRVFGGSTEVGAAPTPATRWWPHLVGDPAALPAELAAWPDLPRAAWHADATERPMGAPRLSGAREPGRAGLFELLVQRAGVAVRGLQGRRLWVAVEAFGNGRDSPVLAALRAWGGRPSWRDDHLPGLYGETRTGAEADAVERAGGADFLERWLAGFEGELSRIEERVAAAHLATLAGACPAPALDWLGAWIGLSFAPGLSEARRRQMLRAAPALWQSHGTLHGLQLALELATGGLDEGGAGTGPGLLRGGAISSGRVVVVEAWRLRRTFATILGADPVDRDDPLVAGLVRSGHSVVGDSLLLGDAQRSEFLALFRHIVDTPAAAARFTDPAGGATGALAAGRAQARRRLFDDLAHRVTLLVHRSLGATDLGLIRRAAELAAPAHVQLTVLEASWPFLCGVASLVAIDTVLLGAPPPEPLTLDRSRVGGIDPLGGRATLDARTLRYRFDRVDAPLAELQLAGSAPGAPAVADLDAPLRLDGRASRAAPGRALVAWRWRLTDRPGAPPEPPAGPPPDPPPEPPPV